LNEKIVLVVPADVVAVSLAFESVKKRGYLERFWRPTDVAGNDGHVVCDIAVNSMREIQAQRSLESYLLPMMVTWNCGES
jgi:hypothetical protein